MENYLRVVNNNGIIKIYFYTDEKEKEPMCMHELKNGDAIRIIVEENGELASINENRL